MTLLAERHQLVTRLCLVTQCLSGSAWFFGRFIDAAMTSLARQSLEDSSFQGRASERVVLMVAFSEKCPFHTLFGLDQLILISIEQAIFGQNQHFSL
jgi:hypothetical protein